MKWSWKTELSFILWQTEIQSLQVKLHCRPFCNRLEGTCDGYLTCPLLLKIILKPRCLISSSWKLSIFSTWLTRLPALLATVCLLKFGSPLLGLGFLSSALILGAESLPPLNCMLLASFSKWQTALFSLSGQPIHIIRIFSHLQYHPLKVLLAQLELLIGIVSWLERLIQSANGHKNCNLQLKVWAPSKPTKADKSG